MSSNVLWTLVPCVQCHLVTWRAISARPWDRPPPRSHASSRPVRRTYRACSNSSSLSSNSSRLRRRRAIIRPMRGPAACTSHRRRRAGIRVTRRLGPDLRANTSHRRHLVPRACTSDNRRARAGRGRCCLPFTNTTRCIKRPRGSIAIASSRRSRLHTGNQRRGRRTRTRAMGKQRRLWRWRGARRKAATSARGAATSARGCSRTR
jgi:hypothetical protein